MVRIRFISLVGAVALAACGNSKSASGTGGKGGGSGGVGAGGSNGAGTGGADAGTPPLGGAGGHLTTTSIDLCAGLIADLQPHAMTAVDKPALGQTFTDPQFGTVMRRISQVAGSGPNAAIVPMYTTMSAWNADESRMILLDISAGSHVLYDGKTYARIKLLDINPADVEQVYWDTSDPDLFYYTDGQEFIRYHVGTDTREMLHDFTDLCGSDQPTNGDDPMFTSWDSHRLGLTCGQKMFIYDWSTDTVLGTTTVGGTPPAQVAPSGALAYLEAGTGQILDQDLKLLRSLTLQAPDNHASLGQLMNGHDTWNGTVYDDGNDGAQSNVGILATWDLTNGSGGAVIGPKTGYPYPPDGHVSAMAYRQPGWIFVSTYFVNGFDGTGAAPTSYGLLDLENLIADTNTGKVCRVGRHRSWGKADLAIGYWAEAHTVPSPSGTRAVFASDWLNGPSVDAYVLELPSYTP